MVDWHGASPHTTHGSLEERDIYTRGDPHNPTGKAAVLRFIDGYSYTTLAPHAGTKGTRLDAKQEIYVVASGHGTATGGAQTTDLFRKRGCAHASKSGVHDQEYRGRTFGDVFDP